MKRYFDSDDIVFMKILCGLLLVVGIGVWAF